MMNELVFEKFAHYFLFISKDEKFKICLQFPCNNSIIKEQNVEHCSLKSLDIELEIKKGKLNH